MLSLLRRFRLSGREQLIVVNVLIAACPITAKELARRSRLAYAHAKSVVRTLVAWQILTRTPQGLSLQSDSSAWGPPKDPSKQ